MDRVSHHRFPVKTLHRALLFALPWLLMPGTVIANAGTDPAGLAAFASEETPETAEQNPDPYEKFNRAMYRFNDILDRLVLKPTAELYNKIMPKPVVIGIRHFFFNIETVPTVINDVLQLNFYQATRDAWRLGINSTVGIGGFFDVAAKMGLAPNREDFGLTLAQWGYKNSNYLMLPFFGPSTPRDAIGLPVDYYLFSVYPWIYPVATRYEIYALSVVSWRAEVLSYKSLMEQAAIDRYVFLRDAYMQHRAWLIERNRELGDPYLEKDGQESGVVVSRGETELDTVSNG